MSELKLNIISTALQAFLFASSPHLLFTKTVCFYLLPLILPSADLLSAICKPSFIALPDGSGSSTGRQRQLYRTAAVKLPNGSGRANDAHPATVVASFADGKMKCYFILNTSN